jgi:hypothetical protein
LLCSYRKVTRFHFQRKIGNQTRHIGDFVDHKGHVFHKVPQTKHVLLELSRIELLNGNCFRDLLFRPDDWGSTFLRNVGHILPNYTVSDAFPPPQSNNEVTIFLSDMLHSDVSDEPDTSQCRSSEFIRNVDIYAQNCTASQHRRLYCCQYLRPHTIVLSRVWVTIDGVWICNLI